MKITWFSLFAFAALSFAAGCLLTARFMSPEKVQAAGSRVFELRIYHTMPGKLPALVNRFGDHTRTILSGLKQERADPQDLVGCQALFVVNLEPRKMAGELSEGMLFDLGFADGIAPALAVPERPLPDGTRAG